MKSRRGVTIAIVIALALPAASITYKLLGLGYSMADVLPRSAYDVTVAMTLDGGGRDVKVHTFLPVSDEHQTISAEQSAGTALRLVTDFEGGDRVANWIGGGVPDGTSVRYSYRVIADAMHVELAANMPVPDVYPTSIAPYLRPEDDVQVDSPEIADALITIGADTGGVRERLQQIYAFTSGLPQRPFKGTTDALTALRLREASCNGKSRLFVALARAAGLPARLVGGLIMQPGSKRTSHQWVEVYVAGHWVPFCPTNHHFAELPASYLTLYHGDHALFTHSSDINFTYTFVISRELVPSPKAKASFRVLNVWALFERLGLPFTLLRTILMLPIGALVVVVFRNVIGMPTFGTFLPALIAAAASETGGPWGVVAVLLIVAVVVVVRGALHRLELLHSPTLAILLAAVAMTILGCALAAEHFGFLRLTRITMFPLAVMAITAERFYLGSTEQGLRPATKELAGTLIVMLACYTLMSSLALQVLVIGFPEVLLVVIAIDIYLGRWVGVRVSEYIRFRPLLRAPKAATTGTP